ncbi:DUF4156 domain-containing protein [Achromobacter insuavis]
MPAPRRASFPCWPAPCHWPPARRPRWLPAPPPTCASPITVLGKDCAFLGDVTGSQGNFLAGAITSNADLETGARNDLKNRAAALGGMWSTC